MIATNKMKEWKDLTSVEQDHWRDRAHWLVENGYLVLAGESNESMAMMIHMKSEWKKAKQ